MAAERDVAEIMSEDEFVKASGEPTEHAASVAIRSAAADADDLDQFRWLADGRLPLIPSAC
jgi:hypothetical protein